MVNGANTVLEKVQRGGTEYAEWSTNWSQILFYLICHEKVQLSYNILVYQFQFGIYKIKGIYCTQEIKFNVPCHRSSITHFMAPFFNSVERKSIKVPVNYKVLEKSTNSWFKYHLKEPNYQKEMLTMKYNGLPWSTMVVHGHTTMVNNCQPLLTMVYHVLLNGRPWLTMV